jgi:hypothetical protein
MVILSKQVLLNIPFSIFAVQCEYPPPVYCIVLIALSAFDPPRHPSGMKALLEHSLQSYGPLPSELRPRRMRFRVNSRPSPYPRTIKTSFTSAPSTEQMRAAIVAAVEKNVSNAAMVGLRRCSSFRQPQHHVTCYREHEGSGRQA